MKKVFLGLGLSLSFLKNGHSETLRCVEELVQLTEAVQFAALKPTLEEVLEGATEETFPMVRVLYDQITAQMPEVQQMIYLTKLKNEGPERVIESLVRDSTQSLQDPHFKALNRRGLLLESLRKIIHSHSWVSGYAQNQRVQTQDFSVVYFDLSLFKLVNDVLGSAHGDRMIQMFLDVLSGTSEGSQGLRRDDIVARWGGDEIVLVMNASAENAELKILPLVNAFKDQMLQEFTPRIIDLYQNNPAARTKIQASILRGPVDVNGLRAMGFLHSEDSLSNPGAMLTATEKLEQGLVTLGLPRWGVGAVDLNKITQPEKQKREILEAVLKAQDEAEKKAEQMKTELIRATGASSRMQNTER